MLLVDCSVAMWSHYVTASSVIIAVPGLGFGTGH